MRRRQSSHQLATYAPRRSAPPATQGSRPHRWRRHTVELCSLVGVQLWPLTGGRRLLASGVGVAAWGSPRRTVGPRSAQSAPVGGCMARRSGAQGMQWACARRLNAQGMQWACAQGLKACGGHVHVHPAYPASRSSLCALRAPRPARRQLNAYALVVDGARHAHQRRFCRSVTTDHIFAAANAAAVRLRHRHTKPPSVESGEVEEGRAHVVTQERHLSLLDLWPQHVEH